MIFDMYDVYTYLTIPRISRWSNLPLSLLHSDLPFCSAVQQEEAAKLLTVDGVVEVWWFWELGAALGAGGKTSPFGPLRFSITKRVTLMNIAVNFCEYVDPVGIFTDTLGRNLVALQGICDCIACIVPCGNLFCLGEESCWSGIHVLSTDGIKWWWSKSYSWPTDQLEPARGSRSTETIKPWE